MQKVCTKAFLFYDDQLLTLISEQMKSYSKSPFFVPICYRVMALFSFSSFNISGFTLIYLVHLELVLWRVIQV